MLEGLDSHLPKVNNPGTIPWADQLQADTLQLFKTLNPAIATIFSTTCEIHCAQAHRIRYRNVTCAAHLLEDY